jgi:hypothetical protein
MLMLLLDERPTPREPDPGGWRARAARMLSAFARLVGDSYLHGSSWGTDAVCVRPDYFVEAVDAARRRRRLGPSEPAR